MVTFLKMTTRQSAFIPSKFLKSKLTGQLSNGIDSNIWLDQKFQQMYCLTYNFNKHVVRTIILTTLRYRLTEEEFVVEREIELSAEKLERSLFFKTISMKETRKWNEDEDQERKDFSIFDSSISDEDQDSAYIKKTLSRVRRDKVL